MSSLKPWSKALRPQDLRRIILRLAKAGNAVHIGSSFSLVEIVSTLYQSFVRLNSDDRNDPDRDILALSKGHGVMALYACFYQMGWIGDSAITSYFSSTNGLKGLASVHVSGIEVSGGSLGHGITVATGMALAAKLRKTDRRVFVILGDGEMNEGSVWESMLFAAHNHLQNLVVVVDANGFQAMGPSAQVLNLESLADRFAAFQFEALEVDGHDQVALEKAFSRLVHSEDPRPKAVIARTVKGKGVSFMENNNEWHYQRLTDETFAAALSELAE